MTAQEFAARFEPVALAVSAGTGINPDVLLAQWGVETAWGNAINNLNNLGNIRDRPGSFAQYASLAAFESAAIATWQNGYYPAVLDTRGAEAQCLAIGRSPWDAGHYDNGGGPGSALLAAYRTLVPESSSGGLFAMLTEKDANALLWRVYDLFRVLVDSDKASPGSFPDGAPVPPIFAPLGTELKAASDAAEALTAVKLLETQIGVFVVPALVAIKDKLGIP